MDDNPYKSPENMSEPENEFRRWEPFGRSWLKRSGLAFLVACGLGFVMPDKEHVGWVVVAAMLLLVVAAALWAVCFVRDRIKRM